MKYYREQAGRLWERWTDLLTEWTTRSEKPRLVSFYYAVGRIKIQSKPFDPKGRSFEELLLEEQKALNYSGREGIGGYPPDTHGGAYYIKSVEGGLVSIPHDLRKETVVAINWLPYPCNTGPM